MIKSIEVIPFKHHVVFFINESWESIDKYLDENEEFIANIDKVQRLYFSVMEGFSAAVTAFSENGNCYVFLRDLERIAVIAHEIIHVVYHILNFVGIEHSRETDEVYAYTTEYILEQILTAKSYEHKQI